MASLLALSRAELEEAKRRSRYRDYANIGTLVVGLAALLFSAPIAYLFTVLALLAQVSAWWFRYESNRLQGTGEEGRRRSLLIAAFDTAPEPTDIAYLRQRFSNRAETEAHRFEDPHYYASTKPAGPTRLCDYLQESVFWSQHLYRVAARRSGIRAILLFISLLLAALGLLVFVSVTTQLLFAKALVVLLGFLIAHDEFGRALAWQAAATQVGAVGSKLQHVGISHIEPALAVFGDYSVATATAPPIPTGIYKSEENRINDLWVQRPST